MRRVPEFRGQDGGSLCPGRAVSAGALELLWGRPKPFLFPVHGSDPVSCSSWICRDEPVFEFVNAVKDIVVSRLPFLGWILLRHAYYPRYLLLDLNF